MTSALDGAGVDRLVWEKFPDYVAVVATARNLAPGPPSDNSERLLREAQSWASSWLADNAVQDLPEVARWREAYASFGVKPRQAKSSVEALIKRAESGLPRIDRLTDTYNAVSVLHRTPIGGENLAAYVGAPRLVISDGTDHFDTVSDGALVHEVVPAGEVVWKDDAGVTCRRWNWRQCVRTRLDESTTEALFIVDALGTQARTQAEATASAVHEALMVDSPNMRWDFVVLERS